MPIAGPRSNQQISDDAVSRTLHLIQPLSEAAAKVEEFAGRMDDVENTVQDVEERVSNVATESTPSVVQVLRTDVGGPRWLDPDTVSPLLWDGVGDGTTDDYAALMNAHDYIKSTGRAKTLHLGGKKYRSNSTLVFDTPVVLDGGGMGITSHPTTGNQSDGPLGGEIQFPAGVSGLLFDKGSWGWTIRDVAITSLSTTAGADIGIELRSGRGSLDNVFVRRFSKGVWLNGNTSMGYNDNLSTFSRLTIRLCRGIGLHLQGSDGNANDFYNLDCIDNAGYGVRDESDAKNNYYSPHFNANALGAMFMKSRSFMILNPYVEGAALPRIYLENTSQSYLILSTGYYAPPEFWSGPEGSMVKGLAATAGRNATILDADAWAMLVRIMANNGVQWQLRSDTPNAGNFSIRSAESNQNVASFRGDSTMASGIGFNGNAPIAQRTLPAAAVDPGSTQNLVNAIRQFLIDRGDAK